MIQNNLASVNHLCLKLEHHWVNSGISQTCNFHILTLKSIWQHWKICWLLAYKPAGLNYQAKGKISKYIPTEYSKYAPFGNHGNSHDCTPTKSTQGIIWQHWNFADVHPCKTKLEKKKPDSRSISKTNWPFRSQVGSKLTILKLHFWQYFNNLDPVNHSDAFIEALNHVNGSMGGRKVEILRQYGTVGRRLLVTTSRNYEYKDYINIFTLIAESENVLHKRGSILPVQTRQQV